jgi:hypothetical protein
MAITLSGDGITSDNITSLAASKLTGSVAVANGGNKVLQTVQVYQSSSRVVWNEANTALTGDFRYFDSAKIGGSITKISSTSYVVVMAFYSCWNSNVHDMYMWNVENSDYRHLGFDPYRMSGPQGNNRTNHTFTQTFTGLGSGTKTFYLALGAGDSRTSNGVLNYNPETDTGNGDTTNAPTTSQMIVMEIEP